MCTCDEQDLCCILEDANNDSLFTLDKPNICLQNIDEELLLENFESSLITVTPPTLTFPYNNPKNHVQRLTLWNRTLNTLKIRVKSPDPDVFTIHPNGKKGPRAKSRPIDQFLLYGLAAKTISIECIPGRYKIARAPLQIFVYKCSDNTCECLQLPLEIYPSTAWFNLPTRIVIPEVVIGRKAHALIILPQPRVSERFFVTFQPTHTQNSVTLSPLHGTVGGDDGIKQLRVTYAPTEYTTVSCSIKVHFPGLSTTTAHEIKILARCRPGSEADLIRKEIAEIESFRPKIAKRKTKYPKLRFRSVKKSTIADKGHKDSAREGKKVLSLFTIAGVARFLLSKGDAEKDYKGDDDRKRKTAVEMLALQFDLHHDEKVKIYNSIKKRLGLDFDENDKTGQRRPRLRRRERKEWEEFQKAVGIFLMGKAEELPPGEEPTQYEGTKPKHEVGSFNTGSGGGHSHRRKSVLRRKSSFRMRKSFKKSVSEEEQKMYKSVMADVQLDLTPKQKFVQIVLTIITRNRAQKRIGKLKTLIQDMRKAEKRKTSKGSSMKSVTASLKDKSKSGQSVGKYGSKLSVRSRGSAAQSNRRKSSAVTRELFDT